MLGKKKKLDAIDTDQITPAADCVSESLETLSEVGGKVQDAAIKSGYGPTIRADAVKKLVDSVVSFQERSIETIAEMRRLSTQNSAEIREAVEAGKKRIARLAAEAQTLPGLG